MTTTEKAALMDAAAEIENIAGALPEEEPARHTLSYLAAELKVDAGLLKTNPVTWDEKMSKRGLEQQKARTIEEGDRIYEQTYEAITGAAEVLRAQAGKLGPESRVGDFLAGCAKFMDLLSVTYSDHIEFPA